MLPILAGAGAVAFNLFFSVVFWLGLAAFSVAACADILSWSANR